jgi:hypothetical protein
MRGVKNIILHAPLILKAQTPRSLPLLSNIYTQGKRIPSTNYYARLPMQIPQFSNLTMFTPPVAFLQNTASFS